MTRPRPPYLQRETSRHGKTVWFVRRGAGKRIRVRGTFGTPEFIQNYHEAVKLLDKPQTPGKAAPGSLEWLIHQYRQTGAWTDLAPSTRRQRANIFVRIIKASGHVPFKAIQRADILAAMEARRDKPFAARNLLETFRGLFHWATENEYVKVDPTYGVKAKRPKTKGFAPWSEDEITKFEAYWPLGTRERLAFDLFRHTGLRRGDVARLGRQHIKDGIIRIRTEKSQGETLVTLKVPPEVQASIDAYKATGLTLICQANGNPMRKESLGNWFKDACNAAGCRDRSAHGLRKSLAEEVAYSGASVPEMDAMFGWSGGGMALHYIKAAETERLSMAAQDRLANKKGASIPAPEMKQPRTSKKD